MQYSITLDNIRNILHSYEDIKIWAELGNTDAIILRLDLENSINSCGLTDIDRQFFKLYFSYGMTQVDIADMFNYTQQGVSKRIDSIIQQIGGILCD